MRLHIGDKKLVTIYFDLPKDVCNNLKHKIVFIIKHNNFLAEHATKKEISQVLFKYKHGSDIHEHGKQ